jgi:hypothetical protein
VTAVRRRTRGVPASQLTSSDKKPQVSWPASSPWVLAVGKAQKLFGTKWKVYKTGSGSKVALPVDRVVRPRV